MLGNRRRWPVLAAAVFAVLPAVPAASAAVTPASVPARTGSAPATLPAGPLPIGARGLPEQRTEETLAPGLTLTTITRGHPDPAHQFWTVGISIPAGEVKPDPDPDADQGALGSRQNAEAVSRQLLADPAVARELADRGWQPRVEAVDYAPRLIGYPGGLVGYTLRVGRYDSRPGAGDTLFKALSDAGFRPFAVFTGQDGRPDGTGPWVIRVLTVDFATFRGRVRSTVGDHVSGRETTSAMAQKAGAVYAVNGGFFTIGSADGTPGVPAGLSVIAGRPQTAATNGRTALILDDYGRRTRVAPLWSRYTVGFDPARGASTGGAGDRHRVDGLNRPPGVIRDCGGGGGDSPTERPVHDFTCTDGDELVVLTPEYGLAPPAGAGLQAVVDRNGVVVAVGPRDGAAVPAGSRVVAATGTEADWLRAHATVGARLRLRTDVTDAAGRKVPLDRRDFVVNGGPRLVERGRLAVDPGADGLLHEDPRLNLPSSARNASWGYSWFLVNHPRTAAGVDRRGRLLLVQADGRQENYSQGLTIKELADVMMSLGAYDAINLDGGGSSATVVNGRLVSSPSDLDRQGNHVERADGDAIVVTPR